MVCKKCNCELPDDSVYCKYCGAEVLQKFEAKLVSTLENKTDVKFEFDAKRKYNKAKCLIEYSKSITKLKQAAELLIEIPDYLDSKKLLDECFGKIKSKKNNIKKLFLICFLSLAVMVGAILLSAFVIVPNYKYDKALELKELENYKEAVELFEEISDYKDSSEQIKNCYISAYGEEMYDKILNVEVNDTFFYGYYEQDNNASNGKEPIEWIVLEKQGKKILLVSKYVLDCQKYKNDSDINSVPWRTSFLRDWLNESFYTEAFDAKQQSCIINPNYSEKDKVFILSFDEIKKYFVYESSARCVATPYAIHNGVYFNNTNKTCSWLTRPTEESAGVLMYPDRNSKDSNFSESEEWIKEINSRNKHGVRPAVWVDFEL